MSKSAYAIAMDVGGTSVKSGVVELKRGAVENRVQTPIDSGGISDSILSAFAGIARRHVREIPGTRLHGIAIAFPGPFDYEAGICRVEGVKKYESLFDVNLEVELRRSLDVVDCPILFRNDAEAAIAGECIYGAGRGYGRVIGVTLGTGLGSAFMVRGNAQKSGKGVPPNGWLYPYPAANVRTEK